MLFASRFVDDLIGAILIFAICGGLALRNVANSPITHHAAKGFFDGFFRNLFR